jgi:DNA-binding GntR family transcriptional regulator
LATPRLDVKPIDTQSSFRTQAYHALKQAITSVNIYAQSHEIRLDERQLSQDLGVSRTPIREAMTLLEQEGFVKTLPRRGIFVVRKTKREIVEMIQVWAALESLAARLVTLRASDEEIAQLRHLFDEFQGVRRSPEGHLDEYSDANIRFHQLIIQLSGNQLIADMTENLFIHVRAIRQMTIGQDNRAARSIVDHLNIIEALERRDTELAERLTRQHTLDLAAHVEKHGNFLS